ncbi:hypothetical protein MMC30_007538 [Trapelia coarctata]|nr:hypothetical protein [Trapelia coarctata]
MAVNTSPTLGLLFNTIVEFRYELMSMLCPSDLYILLPILRCRLNEAERNRYMTIDRQILKSTAFIDWMIKEGYSVVLLGNNLREIHKVMRGKKLGDCEWSARALNDRERFEKRGQDFMRLFRRDIYPAVPEALGNKQSHEIDLNRTCRSYRVKVIIYITYKKALEHNTAGKPVTRNLDIPVPLPGTWNVATYTPPPLFTPGVYFDEFGGPVPEKPYYLNGISGAKLRREPTDWWKRDEATGYNRLWYARTDITEECAEICFFHHAPGEIYDDSAPLEINEFIVWWAHPKFADITVFEEVDELEDKKEIRWEYVHLHREPRVLNTIVSKPDDHQISGLGPNARFYPVPPRFTPFRWVGQSAVPCTRPLQTS